MKIDQFIDDDNFKWKDGIMGNIGDGGSSRWKNSDVSRVRCTIYF